MKILRKIKRLFDSRVKRTTVSIDDGFLKCLAEGTVLESVCLADIQEVFAFKRDLFTVDLICIGFRTDRSGNDFEIDEKMLGYEECLEQLPMIFSGIDEGWFCEVAFPAFETNRTTIWGDRFLSDHWPNA